MLVFPFHPLDPSPFCCPWPQARGPRERQGQLSGPGVLECGLYLAATGQQAALFVWAEPEGSWQLLAVPVRSLLCLPASDALGLSPSAGISATLCLSTPTLGLPAPPATPAPLHFLSVSFSDRKSVSSSLDEQRYLGRGVCRSTPSSNGDLDRQRNITQGIQLLCTSNFPVFKVEVAHCPAARV